MIGTLERDDHHFLTGDDRCLYYGEYTPGGGFSTSTNSLVRNIKKSPSLAGTDQWKYKGRDIRVIADAIRGSLRPADIATSCFVPMPPSKTRANPEYDDRMEQIAALLGAPDVRSVLRATKDRQPRHLSTDKRDPDELRDLLEIDMSLVEPTPTRAVIFDDMVTTGCGFMVAKEKLQSVWRDTRVVGLFVARRVIPKPDFSEFDDL